MPYQIADGKIFPKTYAPRDVLELIKKNNIQVVCLQFTDIPGRLHGPEVPAREITEAAFAEGLPKLDRSSIPGFSEIHESDGLLVPDPNTFSLLPDWVYGKPAARLVCDVHQSRGSGRLPQDPRLIAQKAEEHAKKEGHTIFVGPEIEYFVFDTIHLDVSLPGSGMGYKIHSPETPWGSDGSSIPIPDKDGYFPLAPDRTKKFRAEFVGELPRFGIVPEASHHEVAKCQVEVGMRFDSLLAMGDNVVTYKWFARELGTERKVRPCFLPKPMFGDNGSGMHVHMSLFKGNENTFYDGKDSYTELSQLGRWFLGGVLEHSPALCAIVTPTPNSYCRIVPGYEAPIFIAWANQNRSANVRIPIYFGGSPQAKRLEFRTPDPSCNPYYAFAAIYAAGIDGIKKKLEPPSPVEKNIYELSPAEKKELGIRGLPGNPFDALLALESDESFLKEIFTPEALEKIKEYVRGLAQKRQLYPHPMDFLFEV